MNTAQVFFSAGAEVQNSKKDNKGVADARWWAAKGTGSHQNRRQALPTGWTQWLPPIGEPVL